MKKVALGFLLWALFSLQSVAQIALPFPGPGAASSAPAYQGPGDVVGSAVGYWSCARAYNAALASTSTSLCDLVASTSGAVVCTLRASASGFVDLAASYCAGTTPAAACAAASGGSCRVTKVYDQTGTGNHQVNATLGTMPLLAFGALNSCPGLTTTAARADRLSTGATVTAAQPYTMTGLAKTTTTGGGIVGATGITIDLQFSGGANLVEIQAGSLFSATASGSAYHAFVGVFNNASSSIVVDGAATGGTAGTNALSSATVRLSRNSSGGTVDGTVIESGIWPSGFNATQYGNMNSNMHSATNGCGTF